MSTSRVQRPMSRADFDIAIICALQVESDAVEASFDEFWEDSDGQQYSKMPGDQNSYTFGRIQQHNVVLAYAPGMGKSSAARVAASFGASFPNVRLGLVVGICGGAPEPSHYDGRMIFLGDVIVSTTIVQYDLGGQYADGVVRKDTLEDNLGRPNSEIRAFLNQVQGWKGRTRMQSVTKANTTTICRLLEENRWNRPPSDGDRLYSRYYRHKHHEPTACETCASCKEPNDPTCEDSRSLPCKAVGCDESQLIPWYHRRDVPQNTDPRTHSSQTASQIHFGRMASGDQVIKSSLHRDQLSDKHEVIGFEMEGAGVWDNFPTIIVKGVCDYADSHKDKRWQPFAAAAAAACAKGLLSEWRSLERSGQSAQVAPRVSNESNLNPGALQEVFNFHNNGPVRTQVGKQTNHGPVYNGPVHNTPINSGGVNYGSQIGTNYGNISNNHYGRP